MKKIICIILSSIFIITTMGLTSYAADAIGGSYVSQISGKEYAFSADGSLTCDGESGRYSINGDSITIIVNGVANKYTYEFLDNLLILYDVSGNGEVFEQNNTESESQETSSGSVEQRETKEIDFEEISKSVLLLYCYNGDELLATASGFIAFDDRTIAGNGRVGII